MGIVGNPNLFSRRLDGALQLFGTLRGHGGLVRRPLRQTLPGAGNLRRRRSRILRHPLHVLDDPPQRTVDPSLVRPYETNHDQYCHRNHPAGNPQHSRRGQLVHPVEVALQDEHAVHLARAPSFHPKAHQVLPVSRRARGRVSVAGHAIGRHADRPGVNHLILLLVHGEELAQLAGIDPAQQIQLLRLRCVLRVARILPYHPKLEPLLLSGLFYGSPCGDNRYGLVNRRLPEVGRGLGLRGQLFGVECARAIQRGDGLPHILRLHQGAAHGLTQHADPLLADDHPNNEK
jgi:hypothetical protein